MAQMVILRKRSAVRKDNINAIKDVVGVRGLMSNDQFW